MKNIVKVLILIFVPIVIIGIVYVSIRAYKKKYPGLHFPYKCDQEGDDSSKFFGENWQARGAVCEGLYIPFGVKIAKKDYVKVLAKMGELYAQDNKLKENMKSLSKTAVQQI
mgnify:CR=1 FL=1